MPNFSEKAYRRGPQTPLLPQAGDGVCAALMATVTTHAADTPARPRRASDAQRHTLWKISARDNGAGLATMLTSKLPDLKTCFTLTCLRFYLSRVAPHAVEREKIRVLARIWKAWQHL